MDKNKAEEFKAYQNLLVVMENSRLINSMPLKDRNFIKAKYIHAGVEEIIFATEEIVRQDETFKQAEENAVKRIDESVKNLEMVTVAGEAYLNNK